MICLEALNNGAVRNRSELRDCLLEAVKALIQLVPVGKVTSYSDISRLLGINTRYVGKLLSMNDEPVVIPCHRIVCKNMRLGGYTLKGRKAVRFKEMLLRLEGVEIVNGRVEADHYIGISEEILSRDS